MDKERCRQLMMAELDGELAEDERRELESALAEHPELRVELRRMQELGRRLAGFQLRDPADDVLEELDRTLLKRAGQPVGLLLLLGAALAIWGWVAWLLFTDPTMPPLLRWVGVAVFFAIGLLLLVKIRERWIERREDPYRDVIR